jgi:hypothetical protein
MMRSKGEAKPFRGAPMVWPAPALRDPRERRRFQRASWITSSPLDLQAVMAAIACLDL